MVILWGKKANEIKNFPLEEDEKNQKKGIYILRSSHPSNMRNAKNRPLENEKIKPFSEMKFFKKTNEILEKSDWKTGIDWNTCKYSKTCYKYHKTCFLSNLKKIK